LCPPNFVQVGDQSCYSVISESFDWSEASDACRLLDPEAFPVAINCAEEQQAVEAVSALLGRSRIIIIIYYYYYYYYYY